MSTELNVALGIAFVVLAFSATLLMYHLWGYPFDAKHRALGWAFVVIYIYLMMQMIPRMWTYQVELPARTVLHLVIGFSIGGLLLVKILIVRFFKHLESSLAPALGTTVFVLTLTLLGLALPLVWRERVLTNQALGGEGFSEDRLQRVSEQLPTVGLDDEELLAELSSTRGLITGRKLVRSKCVQCHDLRTILARPRTAQGWRDTVSRMASRATIVEGFSEDEQWHIIGYLIAITPTIQNAVMQRTAMTDKSTDSDSAMTLAFASAEGTSDTYDTAAAAQVFNAKCSQCHSPELPLAKTFSSYDEVPQLVSRMVGNGLVASAEELEQIVRYLVEYHDLAPKVEVVPDELQMPAIGTDAGCAGCHQITTQVLGPAWLDIAERYRTDDQARAKLIDKIKSGGSGNWDDQTGGVAMPAMFPANSEEQIAELVDFILALER